MYPQDIQINTHEDFSCKNWECAPDSFDELMKENSDLKRKVNILFHEVLDFRDEPDGSWKDFIKKLEHIKKG